MLRPIHEEDAEREHSTAGDGADPGSLPQNHGTECDAHDGPGEEVHRWSQLGGNLRRVTRKRT